jgi:hypothetical protein
MVKMALQGKIGFMGTRAKDKYWGRWHMLITEEI